MSTDAAAATTYCKLVDMGYDAVTAKRCSEQHPNDVSAAVAATQFNPSSYTVTSGSGSGEGLHSLNLLGSTSALGAGAGGLDDLLSNANAAAGSNYGGGNSPVAGGGEGDGADSYDYEQNVFETDLVSAVQTYCPPEVFQSIRDAYSLNPDPAVASDAVSEAVSRNSQEKHKAKVAAGDDLSDTRSQPLEKCQINTLILQAQSRFLELLTEGLPEANSEYCDGLLAEEPLADGLPPPATAGGSASGQLLRHGSSLRQLTPEDEANVQDILNTVGKGFNEEMVASVYLQSGRNKVVAIKVLASQ